MSYRRIQRSDREGSFPEPPNSRWSGQSSMDESQSKGRLRRSLKVLQCISLLGKKNRHAKLKQMSFDFSGVDPEASWESAGWVADDFEVRTSSPPRSEDNTFDVSQALQPVPEATSEDEEDWDLPDEHKLGEDAVTSGSTVDSDPENSREDVPSDYSSEFMTDDSTESSGLPWDSSFSQHGSTFSQFDSTDTVEEESRIGIRPFELPPAIHRTAAAEENFVIDTPATDGENGSHRGLSASSTNELGSSDQTKLQSPIGSNDVIEENTTSESTATSSSDAYSDEMRDVLMVLSSASTTRDAAAMSAEVSSTEDEKADDESRKNYLANVLHRSHRLSTLAASTEDGAHIPHAPSSEAVAAGVSESTTPTLPTHGSRVRELMRKFEESSGRRSPPSDVKLREQKFFDSPISSDSHSSLPQQIDVPPEVADRSLPSPPQSSKGFFWRSRPSTAPLDSSSEDLVETSLSTIDGDRSMDLSEVFSKEELEREYSAVGEPEFIHI
jgi:hypothetical protein